MRRDVYGLLLAATMMILGFNACELPDDSDEDNGPVATGSVSGVVINSQTGYGMSYVTVGFTTNGSVANASGCTYTATTDENGNYLIGDIPVGTYICIVDAEGYFVRRTDGVVIVEGPNTMEQQTIVEQPDEGSFRIILTWGESPYDLDSHLTGPSSDGVSRFHVSYMNRNPEANVDLDVDDTYSYGPETSTIHAFMNGMYRFSVFNYSDQSETGGSAIQSSPARVEVYDASGLLNVFTAPVCSIGSNAWRVCEINVSGASVTVTGINTYVLAAGSSDTETF